MCCLLCISKLLPFLTICFFSALIEAAASRQSPYNNASAVALSVSSGSCICMPRHMCQDQDKISASDGFMDIRFDDDSDCANYMEVCCEHPLTNKETSADPSAASNKGCGYEQLIGMGYRITSDGMDAQFGEMPWSVIVLLQAGDKNMYKCGGSLINYQVVLTAAHCVSDKLDSAWMVRVGEWNTRTQDELVPHQDRHVKEIVLHPQYRQSSLKNDLALLFLDEPVVLAANTQFICLPAQDLKSLEGKCIASGWGKNAFKKGKYSSILKKIELPIVPRDLCVQALRATRLGKFYHLDKSFLCAGGETNRDTCKGDGGSPLVCPVPKQPGRWVQIGIVSWGIGCGETKTPGVYVNVALYREWVDEKLAARGLDTSLYKYE